MDENQQKDWDNIGIILTTYFNICGCQRKLKTIVDNLYSIYIKCIDAYEKGTPRDFTGAEWLLLALLDKHSDAVMHGVNCEYPIINKGDFLWKFILEVKDNSNLVDN